MIMAVYIYISMLEQYLCSPFSCPIPNPTFLPLLTDTSYLNTNPMDNRQNETQFIYIHTKPTSEKKQQAAMGVI